MTNVIWTVGAAGYYSSLVVWIVAQRTYHLHGKYSHSWMIGALLLIFGILQIIGSSSSLIVLASLIALIMPIIVTSLDFNDHRREGRGAFEHKPHCWMQERAADELIVESAGQHSAVAVRNGKI
jgi:hypothetical protein